MKTPILDRALRQENLKNSSMFGDTVKKAEERKRIIERECLIDPEVNRNRDLQIVIFCLFAVLVVISILHQSIFLTVTACAAWVISSTVLTVRIRKRIRDIRERYL